MRPLKNAEKPSCLIKSRTTVMPPTLDSKFWFWMRVCVACEFVSVDCRREWRQRTHLDDIEGLRDGDRRDLRQRWRVSSWASNVFLHHPKDVREQGRTGRTEPAIEATKFWYQVAER